MVKIQIPTGWNVPELRELKQEDELEDRNFGLNETVLEDSGSGVAYVWVCVGVWRPGVEVGSSLCTLVFFLSISSM